MKILPQNIKIYKFNSLFTKVFCFFVLLMSISIVVVGYLSYANSSKLLVEEVKNANMALLQQAKSSIEQQVEKLENITMQILMDKRINQAYYLHSGNSPSNQFIYKDAIAYLANIKLTNEAISDIYLYFNKSDIIINTVGKYEPLFFKNNVSIYTPDNHWPEQFDTYSPFISLGRYLIKNNTEDTSVISFTRSLPFDEAYPEGSLVINIKEEAFKNMISAVIGDNPTFIYVIDEKGNIITNHKTKDIKNMDEEVANAILSSDAEGSNGEYSFNKMIDQEEYTIVATSSYVNNWKYVSVIPTTFIASKADSIGKITLVFMTLSFFIGLIVAYIMTKLIYEPINKIINYIGIIKNPESNKEIHNELDFINMMIKFVYSENKSLRKSLNDSIPKLQGIFLSDVLDGDVSDKQFKENIKTLNLDIPFKTFQVAVFSIDNLSDYFKHYKEDYESMMERQLASFAKKILLDKANVNIIKKDQQTIVCLFNISKNYERSEDILDFLKTIITQLNSEYGISSTVGVGRAYNAVKDITGSYMEALFALKFKIVQGQNTIIHIDEVSNIPEHIFEYSLDKEKQIINIVKSGDYQMVKECLDNVICNNVNNPGIYPEMINNLFNALAGTATRTVYEIQSSLDEVFGANYNIYDALQKEEKLEAKKDIIFDIFEKITTYIVTKSQSQNQKVHDQIINFVEENYTGDISLNILGDVIGLSPSYLSWIFKEVSGQHFVDYVNSFRIEKAKRLLKEKVFTIGQVASEVGFNTPNNFNRVFKKYEGITPGQFRQIN